MEAEGSSPCSKGPATGPYPDKMIPVHTHISSFFKRLVLLLHTHLRLGLQNGLFLSVFRLKFCMHFPFYTSHPPNPPWFYHPNNEIKEYKLWSSSSSNFLHPPVIPPFKVQIFSSAPCSQKPSNLYSSLNVTDQVSHPYKTTGKLQLGIF
jgi:hypothetical protein